MASDQIANYLQVLRRKSGFSQNELALVLGIVTESQLSRHERSVNAPGLLAALAYEALFHKPVSEIFPGFYRAVSAGIEERLVSLEQLLGESSTRGHKAAAIARKLEFMWERRNVEPSHAIETS
jgi:transcriptional regulator with XRE-family HTH domain